MRSFKTLLCAIGGLTLYKCMAKFSGSSDRFEISLNKNDVVKVLDRKDHGAHVCT